VIGANLDVKHGIDRVSPCLFANDILQLVRPGEVGVDFEGRESTRPVFSGKGDVLSKGFVVERDCHIDRVLDFENPVKLAESVSVLRALLSGGIYARLAYEDTNS